jgi:predicted transcriptional regulator of viral defense system
MPHKGDVFRLRDVKVSPRPLDALVAALAAAQHGVVSRVQLFGLGLTREMIDGRIARGVLHRVHRGVYAVGHSRLTQQGRYMAAVLAGGGGAVLSHRSAAAHWRIARYSGRITVTAPRRRRAKPKLVPVCSSTLAADEVTIHEGIPITTVARTILDLAAVQPPSAVEKAIREAEYLRRFDLDELQRLLHRHSRRKGTADLRRAIAAAAEQRDRTRSDLEDRFIHLLLDADLPMPELNATLELDATTLEADALWRDRKLIVELDGRQAHGTRSAFESDRERDLALAAAGWTSIRITWRGLGKGLPQDLRRLLEPQ